MNAYQEYDDRICPKHAYGEHIQLTCVHHKNLRWCTKNISPIGARRVFFNLESDENMGAECTCPASDLVHVCEEDTYAR